MSLGYLRYFGLLDYTHVPAGYIPHVSLVVNTHVRATALFKRSAMLAARRLRRAAACFRGLGSARAARARGIQAPTSCRWKDTGIAGMPNR